MTDQIARTENQLGAIVRHVRKQVGLSQGALGEQINLAASDSIPLEAGESAVQLHTLMEALSALNLVVRPRSHGSSADIEDLF